MTTAWESVVAAGVLRGFSFSCATPISILVDGDPRQARPAVLALRLLAGIATPSAGRVVAFGGDPARDHALRRSIALLGDPVLLEDVEDARALASVRGVKLDGDLPTAAGEASRRSLADRLANADQARLLLVSHPEEYVEGEASSRLFAQLRACIARSVPVVIATRSLDEVLALAPDDGAVAAVIRDGVVIARSPAHELPWSLPFDATTTRLVRVLLAAAQPDTEAALAPSARLASELMGDVDVASSIAQAELLSATELRVRTRDPRALARAIARRAKAGLDVRSLTVVGASAAELAGRT